MRVEDGVKFWLFVWVFFFLCAAKKLWFVSFLFTLTVLSCIVSLSVLLFYKRFYNILFYCLNFKSWSRWLSGDMMNSVIYWKCPVQVGLFCFFFLIACFMIYFYFYFLFFFLFLFLPDHILQRWYTYLRFTGQDKNGSHFHNTSQHDSYLLPADGLSRAIGASGCLGPVLWSVEHSCTSCVGEKLQQAGALAPLWSFIVEKMHWFKGISRSTSCASRP